MHELALCEGIRQIVEQTARREGATRVVRVNLEIGAFTAVEPDALRFCFDAVMQGTPAEGATLEIDLTPGTAFCLDCAATVPLATRLDPCPRCAGGRLVPDGGTEMRVRAIDVL